MANDNQAGTIPAATRQNGTLFYPIVVISLCAIFLFYKYILQVYPSIITEQLMAEYHLTAAGLGNLAATFYYSYMITQLFVGVLLDKYSPRALTTLAIFASALGVFGFSRAEDLLMAEVSRALMGFGVAFATVAYMKLAAVWFPPHRYAFVSGLLATAAMAGAVFGEAPLALLINEYGWRPCLFTVGIVGFIVTVFFAVIVRDKNHDAAETTPAKAKIAVSDIMHVLKNKQNWLLTLYSGLAFSPIAVFGGLWGNPFIQQAYHLTKTQAASMVSLVFVGLGVGSPLLGMLSDYLGNRKQVMFCCTLASCGALALVLYADQLPLWAVSSLLFLFGFGLGSFMLCFAIGKELNNPALTATVIAMINASDAILDAITEPLIGKFLDWRWDGTLVNGVHQFSIVNYQTALSVLLAYLIASALLLLLVKAPARTHPINPG